MNRLRPVDLLILGYVAMLGAVALVRAPGSNGTRWLLVACSLTGLLVMLSTSSRLGRAGQLLRELYPILLLGGLYGALDILNTGHGTGVYDVVVMGWEDTVFGGQPSRDWWRAAPSHFWSLVFHGAYLAYYIIIPLPPIYFAATGNTRALRRAVFLIMATFVICYLFFVFFPVAGPYYQFERPSGTFVANPMAGAVYGILASGSSYGAAFPSSHVAATVAAVAAAWWGAPRLGLALSVPTALLVVGVVYTQMHYAVDALAGIAVALTAIAITGILERQISLRAAHGGRLEPSS